MTEDEMFNKIWFAYPSDLCKNKRGGKQPALQAFKKLKLNQKDFDTLMLNMAAQVKNDRNDKDAYRWPFVSTYLNQRRFDDTVTIVEKPVYQSKECCQEGCKDPVHGQSFKHCGLHLPRDNSDPILIKLRQKYKDLGLIQTKDETKQEHLARCKKVYKDSLGGVFS